jgi:hypothetical protein
MASTKSVPDRCGNPIVAGATIRIPKGAEITGTFPKRVKHCRRDNEIVVHRVAPGWPATSPHRYDQAKPDEIVWAGAGGYWHYVQADQVELVAGPCGACVSGEAGRSDHSCAASRLVFECT